MLLRNLLPENNNFNITNLDLEISSIEIDSRKVQENSIFFALKGKETNGTKFIDSAIQKGAKVIICSLEENPKNTSEITLIKVNNPHDLLVFILQRFYPKLPKNIIAITGTNGKTSVAEFCRQILENLGKKAATIGTLGVNVSDLKIKDKIIKSSLTTPDLISFYKNLSILKEHNIDFVIIEASSIGLEQGRIDGIKIKAGVFTNFTQDHLDYHGNMDQYFASKMILFNKILPKSAPVIINSDSQKFSDIKKICQKNELRIISYGKSKSNFHITSSKEQGNFREISLCINSRKEINFKLSLLENFQAVNIICALSVVSSYLELDEDKIEEITKDLINLTSVSGRMQKVATLKNNAKIYIDFAHTPDALENLLKIAKKYTSARVIVVFGCGGDRDNRKRPLMGKIAANLSDLAIVTDDNPRTQKASLIRKEIIAGITNKTKIIEIEGRKEAIHKAILSLEKDDILIIAGKGHEKYQIVGKENIPFDEEKIIQEFINSNILIN